MWRPLKCGGERLLGARMLTECDPCLTVDVVRLGSVRRCKAGGTRGFDGRPCVAFGKPCDGLGKEPVSRTWIAFMLTSRIAIGHLTVQSAYLSIAATKYGLPYHRCGPRHARRDFEAVLKSSCRRGNPRWPG